LAGFRDHRLGVELYINHRFGKEAFDLLLADRAAIDAEFDESLDWRQLDKGARIGTYRMDLDPRDATQRPAQYAWFLDTIGRFVRAFGNRIRALSLQAPENTPPSADAAGA
jgi:hypothetical protein